MPLATAPNLIEVTDFSDGWMPDSERSSLPRNSLLSATNVLPNLSNGTLEVRRGFKRIAEVSQGYTIQTIHPYSTTDGPNSGDFLVVVATTEADAQVGNVVVWRVRLSDGNVKMVSPNSAGSPTKSWTKGDARHGAAVVNGVFYGFPKSEPMYSWAPAGSSVAPGWTDDPSDPSYPTWTTQDFSGTERPAKFAFRQGDEVMYTDPVNGERAYEAARGIRFRKWESGEDYAKGDRVSLKREWNPGNTFWRSFRCKKRHDADATNRPGDGTGTWWKFWRPVTLSEPANEDGEVNDDWNLVPTAPSTHIATWHGNRLWMRYDDIGDTGRSRLIFSPPSKPKRKSDVGELEWHPDDWRIGTLKGDKGSPKGDGGGWENFEPGDGDDIVGIHSHGYYMLVFKRHKTFTIAGLNRRTWHKRRLASVGAAGPNSMVEHNGTVYFLGDQGLHVTDGTRVEEAPGSDHIKEWLRESLDWDQEAEDIRLLSYRGFIWIILPTGEGQIPDRAVAYHPETESFWPLDLEVSAATVARDQGMDHLFFAQPTHTGEFVGATHSWLGDPHRSQSQRDIGGNTETNLFLNPSWEPKPKTGNPTSVEDWETITEAQASAGWPTTNLAVKKTLTKKAARRGRLGMKVYNNKEKGVGTEYQGIYQTFADEDATQHTISMFVRKDGWKKWPKISYDTFRFFVGSPSSPIPEQDHTYQKIGRGWWRVSATYTGSATQRDHGFVMRGKLTLHVDKALCQKGSLRPYFDGDGSDKGGGYGVEGGDVGVIFQYDHPDVQVDPMDDEGGSSYTPIPISWEAQSAWFPFGALREDRRIRRIWTMVRGVHPVVLRGYRNYIDSPEFEVESTPDEDTTVGYHEGRTMPDAFAVNVGVEGIGAPAAVLGVAVATEPRRVRYHQ